MRLRLRGARSGHAARTQVTPVVVDEDDDDVDEAPAARVPAPPGPVPLVLTTREQIEKAAAGPPVVRRRLERGAYGGTAGGHGSGCAC